MATGWIILAQFVFVQLASGSIVNIALKKPVNVSSRLNGRNPALAVDGNTNAVDPTGVMHTAVSNETIAWWWVDLQSEVQDPEVKIYFRTDYKVHRNGVQLYTSTTSFNTYPSGDLCYTVTGRPDGTDIPDVVSVNCSGTWRYLMVYTDTDNSGGGNGAVLDFGEVEVLACNPGTYGANCIKSCSSRHCSVTSTPCDRFTGVCTGGCEVGWMGIDCMQACNPGTYGANCIKSCSSRHCSATSTPCDRFTGVCTEGCEVGWMGIDCMQACTPGTYGANCIKSCSSRHCSATSTSCDRFTGVCNGGCEVGWMRIDCMQACPSSTYGPYCNHSCGNCTGDNICNHVTGNCPGDCKAGWQGSQCKQTCLSGKYGVNCMETCGHCMDTCDVVNGHCLGGCEEGYSGAQCHLRLMSDPGVDCVSSAMIGAVIGAVVMFAVIGGVNLCLLRYGRLQWMKSSRPKDSTQPREMTDIARPHDISHGVAEHSLSGSSHTYNNDYAVLDTDTKSDNKDYDVIKNKTYENL